MQNMQEPLNVQPTVVYQTDPNEKPMTLGDWLVTLLIQMIPCIGIIMLFVWAFGGGNVNRKRYAQAALIFAAIVVVIYVFILIIAGAAISSLFQNLDFYS